MDAYVCREVNSVLVVSVVNEQTAQNIFQMFVFKGNQSWVVGVVYCHVLRSQPA